MRSLVTAILCCLAMASAQGHQLSTAYFNGNLNQAGVVSGEWQVKLFDLEQAVGLDRDSDGQLRWGELQSRAEAVQDYLSSQLSFLRGGRACPVAVQRPWKITEHFNEGYLVVPVRAQCPLAGDLQVRYQGFFEQDPGHKLLLRLGLSAEASRPQPSYRILSNQRRNLTLSGTGGSVGAAFQEFVVQGAIHIWKGIDHLLFLLSLLLACVLTRRNSSWEGRRSTRAVIINAAWVVTAFTLAHSVTLTATALGWISLPSRWIESGIAASVAIAALNNVYPLVLRLGWLTFAFGLLHGMGFAGVLGELGVPADQQVLTVLAFNLGVEIGQLFVVLLVLPMLMLVRHRRWYHRYGMPLASVLIALVALRWVIERI